MVKKIYRWLMPIYCLLLFYLMFYGFDREVNRFSKLQIVPFKTIFSLYSNGIINQHFLINFLANILFFVPFGWLGFYNKVFESVVVLILTFVIGITTIEMGQYFTGRGYADIDDVILNTFGVFIGFLLYKCYKKRQNTLL